MGVRLPPLLPKNKKILIKIMAKFRPVKYVQEVKNEIDKVTWPSRRETTVTSIMVLIFVFIAAIFFLLSDQLLSWVVGLILGIGV